MKKLCPECGKQYIKLTKYTDGSKFYTHNIKKGYFGCNEVKGCFKKPKS